MSEQQNEPQLQGPDAATETNITPPAVNVRSVSNSTDSEPHLFFSAEQQSEPPNSCAAQNYKVMTAHGVTEVPPDTFQLPDKTVSTSIDMRQRKVLETIYEDPREELECHQIYSGEIRKEPKAPQQSNKFMRSPESNVVEPPKPIGKHTAETRIDKESICKQLSSVYRAFYNPPQNQNDNANLPPQLQIVPCFSRNIEQLMRHKMIPSREPMSAVKLKIQRSPIECPDLVCHQPTFISDFIKHFIINHSNIPVDRIVPVQLRNFLLDIRMTRVGTSKSHMVYLIKDKVVDLGCGEFKDFLPMVLMTAWVNALDLCKVDRIEQTNYSKNAESIGEYSYLAIWLTGIVPEDYPIKVNLVAWSQQDKETVCHRVYSGEIYSVRQSQQATEVLRSGKVLLLSPEEVQMLTRNEKERLKLQVFVH